MAEFVPGVALARAFYAEIVGPLLGDLPHTAAAIGWGSDILGYDTERSTDHGWGPRLKVFVAADHVEPVRAVVDGGLPEEFRGFPTTFGWDDIEPKHYVEVVELGSWLEAQLGVDPRTGLTPRDWLLVPQQLLLEVTAGEVFHDATGELTEVRRALEWFPQDVWLWLLACQWQRIGQEEAFVGRTAEVGDELGSRVIASRLVRDLMRLCFLHERRYAPYSKWLGTAFSRLSAAAEVGPMLGRVLGADDYASREAALVDAYEAVARRHNALGITGAIDAKVRQFHLRPYVVLFADRFAAACREAVTDRWLRSLPLVGSIDQFADSTDVLSNASRARRLAAIYD